MSQSWLARFWAYLKPWPHSSHLNLLPKDNLWTPSTCLSKLLRFPYTNPLSHLEHFKLALSVVMYLSHLDSFKFMSNSILEGSLDDWDESRMETSSKSLDWIESFLDDIVDSRMETSSKSLSVKSSDVKTCLTSLGFLARSDVATELCQVF